MMLMPEAPAPGRIKPVNGFERVGREGWHAAGGLIHERQVPGAHLDRQRTPVEAALE